ncbi:phage protein NinX family protein [Cronobacter sp. JZ38]|uniref:phage protein NinX family protein n=1 Tax=Cronobacter sp. JZ38 TaxID=1906275 RepID=UPI00129F5D6F|nr:phage protein NinX family protein [Cronobacter sp. JZ38]
MDYSKLSDYEINKRVAIATGHKKFNSLGWQGAQEDGCSAVVVRGPMRIGVFDPCNNTADAWPIIVGSKINIRFGAEGMPCEAQFMQYGCESVECYHNNPLRAAMIVFLMMQESQDA